MGAADRDVLAGHDETPHLGEVGTAPATSWSCWRASAAVQKHKAFPSIFDLVAREHSRKPDEFYRMVAERTPDQDRCDLFSRETRPGFDGWGREHGKFDLVA